MNCKTVRTVVPVIFGPNKAHLTTLVDSPTVKPYCELIADIEGQCVFVRDRRTGEKLIVPFGHIACMEPTERGKPDENVGSVQIGPRTVTKAEDNFVDTRLADLEPKAKHGKKRAA